MRLFKKIMLGGLGVFVLLQLIRPQKNESTLSFDNTKIQGVPDNVQAILKNACYDCHSNNTNYPWYSSIQPVAFMLNRHIFDGKEQLNFDEFLTYSFKKQFNKIKSIGQQIKDDEMPLKSYRWIHTKARLTDNEKTLLVEWSDSTYSKIKNKLYN